jgi:protein ImuA
MMSEPVSTLQELRRKLEALGSLGAAAPPDIPSGADALDRALGGGLKRGALHELLAAQGLGDAAASAGFGLGLALRAAAERPIVWVRQDFVALETGRVYGPGLAEYGLDPARLVLVAARQPTDVLRAAEEAVRCTAVGAVLAELWGTPKALTLKASRRLALAAASSGTTLILIRLGAEAQPSPATTRWRVEAAPSRPLEANAPGPPTFLATLLRHRAGLPGRAIYVEWDRDRLSFADPAALSRIVVSAPAERPLAAEDARPGHDAWRRAG